MPPTTPRPAAVIHSRPAQRGGRSCGWWPLVGTWLVLVGAGVVEAQVEVSIRLVHNRTVQHEPVVLEVRVQNDQAQPIVLGGDVATARLWLEVEQSPGRMLRPQDTEVVKTEWVIPPRSSDRRRFFLSRVHDLRNMGPYSVWARLEAGGRHFQSNRAFLDVVPGLELKQVVGAAGPGDAGQRVYRLMTLNRERGEHLLLRIDDADRNVCYAVIHLGRLLRVYSPQMRVDEHRQITVLHQAGPGRFFYQVFTPNGREVVRRVYISEEPGVRLVPGEGGRYIVAGATSSAGPFDNEHPVR